MKQQEFRTGVTERRDGTKEHKKKARQINIGLITSVEKKEMSEGKFENVQKEE